MPVLDASAGGEVRVKSDPPCHPDPAALLRQYFDSDPSEWLADFVAFRERWQVQCLPASSSATSTLQGASAATWA